MAAGIDAVLDTLAAKVSTAIAPYQPNLPGYPNTDYRAGTIPSTLVTPGHPIQNKVMERLENKMSQVAVYDDNPERVFPFINSTPVGMDANGNAIMEVAASSKKVVIEVWSYDRTSRGRIRDIIRSTFGDAIRQTELDTTTTLLRFTGITPQDNEQKDSVYIDQMGYMADFTITSTSDQGALVTDATLTIETEDMAGNNGQVIAVYHAGSAEAARQAASLAASTASPDEVTTGAVTAALSGQRVVVQLADSTFIYADSSDITHVSLPKSLTTGASFPGEVVPVTTFGYVSDPSWNWTPNESLFLGHTGFMTQTPPSLANSDAFQLQVAVAITANTILWSPQLPIVLA